MGNSLSGDKPKYDKKLKGHDKQVKALAFSPDSTRLVSGSEDNSVLQWDSKGNCTHVLHGHSGSVNTVAFSPDGQTIASGSNDTTIRLWTLQGKCKHQLRGHTAPITCLMFSPDGKLIITGSKDKTVRIWSTDGECLNVLEEHSNEVQCMDFSDDNNTFITAAKNENEVIYWNREGKLLNKMKVSEGYVNSERAFKILKFLNDNNSILVIYRLNSRPYLHRYDKTGSCLQTIGLSSNDSGWTLSPNKLAYVFYSDSNQYYDSIQLVNFAGDTLSRSEKNRTRLIRLYDFMVGTRTTYKFFVNCFAFSPDGHYLAAGVRGAKIYLWDLPSRGVHVEPFDENTNINAAAAAAEPAIEPASNHIDSHSHHSDQGDDSHSNESLAIHSEISIQHDQLQVNMQELLGSGSYGQVYKGEYQGMNVAVKQLYDGGVVTSKLQDFEKEVTINAKVRHDNCVRFYGACFTPPYSIVMELMTGGSLYDLLRSDKALPWKMRYSIAKDVANGLMHLHSQDIIHRDIKSLNVMLSDTLRAKLTDFGLGKLKQDTHSASRLSSSNPVAATPNTQASVIGTTAWNAPELLQGRRPKHTRASDMYSFGMVLWELASRRIPFNDALSEQQIYDWVKNSEKEEIPADTPANFAKLISSLWAKPNERPTANEAAKVLLECSGQNKPFKPLMST